MAHTRNLISIEDISVEDIILVEVKIKNAIGLQAVGLLARVLDFDRSYNRVRVDFLSSDNSTIIVNINDCYYPANKQKR